MGGDASKNTSADTNQLHKQRFKQLHDELVHTINPNSAMSYLFSKNVLSIGDMRQLQTISDPVERCERLAALLRSSRHPHSFVELRLAIRNDPGYSTFEAKMKDLPLALTGVSKVLHTSSDGKPVCGIATIGEELFLLRPKAKDQVEIYDVNSYTLKDCLSVPGLCGLADMASCRRNRCLYISDHIAKCVHKLELNGQVSQWRVGDAPHGLSVGFDTNVLVTCHEARKLKILKPPNGDVVEVIALPRDIVNPWQAIQVSSRQYILGHGQSIVDKVHRLCLMNVDDKTFSSYGNERGAATGQLCGPVRLAVDSDEFVFVVDVNNKRIVLLSSKLTRVCDVVKRGRTLKWWPYRLCVDVSRRRLYVADCGQLKDGKPTAGRLMVFAV